jgi:PAS domain S-box-containing protein
MAPGPAKHSRIWTSLSLRWKAAASLALPLPFLALAVVFAGTSGTVRWQASAGAALLIEILVAFRIWETAVRRIRELQRAADLVCREQSLPGLPAHSWELNGLGRHLEMAASLLQQRRRASDEAGRRLEELFENTPVAYVEAEDGIIRHMNRAACGLVGDTWQEWIGMRLRDVIEPAGAADASTRSFEADYTRKDGTRLLLNCHAHEMRDAEGAVAGMRWTILDITQIRRAAEKIAQCDLELQRKDEEVAKALAAAAEAQGTKARFLSNMSHELRIPLNGIIGFAELMYDGKVGSLSPEQREYLGDILASARQLLQFIDDVLDLAKGEAGKPAEVRAAKIDLEALFHEMRYVMGVLSAQKRGLTIAVEIDPRVHEVVTDATRLKQVVYNYLSNAVKFSPEYAKITLRALAEGPDAFRVEVEDNGIGISPEKQDKLFLEFQRVHEEGEQRIPGTGLGLAITRRLVEEQGGHVGVRSTTGRGSVFFAVLPTELASEKQKTPAVLVVESEPEDCEWLVTVLTGAGYAVETATSGAEALDLCRARVFDAITLDPVLPDLSGWEVLRAIRTGGANRSVPVIMASVAPEKGTALGFPIQDSLPKPVNSAQLLKSLQDAGVPPDGSRTVLVVDQDVETLEVMLATLSRLGYRPVCRRDAEHGLQSAAEDQPSAVVLDLQTSGIDDFELLEKLGRDPSGSPIPVIVSMDGDLTAAEYAKFRRRTQSIALKRNGSTRPLLQHLSGCVRKRTA